MATTRPKIRTIKSKAFNLTRELLAFLAYTADKLPNAFETSRDYLKRLRGYPARQITLAQINKALWELKQRRLIRKKQNRDKLIYEITDLGRAKHLKWVYRTKPKKVRKDGLATIVIFDIPESKKKSRDYLRRFLQDNNFTPLQESVFIGRFWLLEEFKELLDELRIAEHVTFLEGRVPHR